MDGRIGFDGFKELVGEVVCIMWYMGRQQTASWGVAGPVLCLCYVCTRLSEFFTCFLRDKIWNGVEFFFYG